MTEEPDNVILRMLREFRNDFDDIKSVLAEHSEKFEHLNKRMDEVHESMFAAVGMAGHANVRHDSVAGELKELRKRIEKLEEKV